MKRRVHRLDCDRFLGVPCECKGRLLPESECCTPLQVACELAREDVRARVEAAEREAAV